MLQHVRQLFELTDTENTGNISWTQFKEVVETPSMQEYQCLLSCGYCVLVRCAVFRTELLGGVRFAL